MNIGLLGHGHNVAELADLCGGLVEVVARDDAHSRLFNEILGLLDAGACRKKKKTSVSN